MPPGHSALYMLIPVSHQHPNVDWSKEGSQKRVLRSGRADASLRDAMLVNSTHPDLASQARHKSVARVGTFASRNVVDARLREEGSDAR